MLKFFAAAVLVCVALFSPVQARPRDDVMSAAYRCAAIAESRQWLDCYYGAAQPVRAALALPPAPQDQLRLAASPPLGGAARDGDIRDDVMAAASACLRSAGDRAWLDCYYSAASPMRLRLGLATAPARSPAPPPRSPVPSRAAPAGPPPMPRSSGLLDGLFNAPRPIVRKIAMQSFTLDRNGAFTVTLADGQVWEQPTEDAVAHPAHWRRAGPDVLVTISPDAMHTYTMMVAGEQRIYKVHRVR